MEQKLSSPLASPTRACLACKGQNLIDVLDLGEQYVIDFIDVDSKERILKAPLQLALCGDCGLTQLKHIVPRDLMYKTYWYKSGVSPAMTLALKDITYSAERIAQPKPGDIVIDIGANDGTLLRSYSRNGLRLVGFEPSNIAKLAEGCGKIINDYFNANAFLKEYPNEYAKIVTAIAMFYDLENPDSFLQDIVKILHADGIFIVQMNYLGTMIERNTFDNICHEHLAYYSIRTFNSLLSKNGLEMFDVQLNDVNGGSFRAYIRHRGSSVSGVITPNVRSQLTWEDQNGLDKTPVFDRFARNVHQIGNRLHSFIYDEVQKGKKIYVLGASTRGNTILQFAGLDNQLITAAADRNPEKWGKRIVGSNIPIISKDQARKDRPDYFLVLPYGFLEELKEEEQDYLRNGGAFIVPIPYPYLLTGAGQARI